MAAARKLYEESADDDLRIPAGTARYIAAAALSEDVVDTEASTILVDYPNDPVLLATYLGVRPDAEEREDLRERLKASLPPNVDGFTKDRAAHALYGIGDFSAAGDIFLSLCDPSTDDDHLRLAIKSLGRCRRLKDARKLYKKLSSSVLDNPDIRRLGIWISEESGQLEMARNEFEAYSRLVDVDLGNRLVWLGFCLRIPDREAVAEYLKNVDVGIEGTPLGERVVHGYLVEAVHRIWGSLNDPDHVLPAFGGKDDSSVRTYDIPAVVGVATGPSHEKQSDDAEDSFNPGNWLDLDAGRAPERSECAKTGRRLVCRRHPGHAGGRLCLHERRYHFGNP